MSDIYAVKIISPIEDEKYKKLLKILPKKKQDRISRFLYWQDAHKTLIADLLIRTIIYKKLGKAFREQFFATNLYGKPFLQSAKSFHFNISHSGDWVVCITSTTPVGIDIEKIKSIDLSFAERFLSNMEYISLLEKPENERLAYFYDLWTLKESFIKAVGKGLNILLNSFSVTIEKNGILKVDTSAWPGTYYFKQYHIQSGYKLAACLTQKDSPNGIFLKDINEIYWEFIQGKE